MKKIIPVILCLVFLSFVSLSAYASTSITTYYTDTWRADLSYNMSLPVTINGTTYSDVLYWRGGVLLFNRTDISSITGSTNNITFDASHGAYLYGCQADWSACIAYYAYVPDRGFIQGYGAQIFWDYSGYYMTEGDSSYDFGGLITANLGQTANLTVIIDSPAGGNVTVDNIACATCPCQYSIPVNNDAVIEATPTNSSWTFVRFEWNDGANSSTDNPLTINMDSAKTVRAVFRPVLQFPLTTGTLESRKLTHYYWEDIWDCEDCGQCPTGVHKLHSGVDLYATYGEEVDAAHGGVIKKIFTDQYSTWADAIVIESTDSQFTTVYWHIIPYGNLAEEDIIIKGQQIATIAYLPGNTHFHFGIRMAPYSYPESFAGALPVADGCNYLAFPEKFINPETAIYE